MSSRAFAKRWARNWRPRVATGIAALVGVVAGAGFIAATNKPSAATSGGTTRSRSASGDGSTSQSPAVSGDRNDGLPWGDDNANGFQQAPFSGAGSSGSDWGSSNLGSTPQSSTHAS